MGHLPRLLRTWKLLKELRLSLDASSFLSDHNYDIPYQNLEGQVHLSHFFSGGSKSYSKCQILLCVVALVVLFAAPLPAQKLSRMDRELAETMLDNVSRDMETYYYDPKLEGLEWTGLVEDAKAKIDQAPNMAVANAEIAALLEKLNDSHTRFIPPRNLITARYGFDFKIFGKNAYITHVKQGSDAAKKGLATGDQLLLLNGFTVDRDGAEKLKVAMNVLMPQKSLDLVFCDLSSKVIKETVQAEVKRTGQVMGLGDSTWNLNERIMRGENSWEKERSRYKELGPDLMVLKIPAFVETRSDVDDLFRKAKNHKALIVDLRGTPGGRVDSVMDFLGDVFTHEIKVGNWVARNKTEKLVVRPNSRDAFTGDLIVLIDSETASGGEIFSRMIQLEERGTILGDHSSGMTMESEYQIHRYGENPIYYYGDSVTVASTVMEDGKSLEHIGVEPDRKMLPSAADIAAKRDPVLAYAAGLEGVKLSPEDAAKLFPEEKQPED